MASNSPDAKGDSTLLAVVDSASNPNITDTCLQLALEGEKLCKAGNCGDGIAFFEAALQVIFFK